MKDKTKRMRMDTEGDGYRRDNVTSETRAWWLSECEGEGNAG